MNNYALAFNIGLVGVVVCYALFFLTGRKYVLGIACLLTFIVMFFPVLVDRGQKTKEIIR